MSMPKRFMLRSNSVSCGRMARRSAMAPKAVRGPVARMTTVAVPLTTDVPMKTRFGASGPFDCEPSPGLRALLRRQRLAGKGRLLDVEIARFEHAPSAGMRSPAETRTMSSGTIFAAIDLLPGSVAEDGGGRGDVGAQTIDGLLGAISLDKIDGDAEKDNDQDDDGVGSIAEYQRGEGGHEQDDDERVQEQKE